MKNLALLLLLFSLKGFAADHPGYGVVESVSKVPPPAPSASTGASAPRHAAGRYLVTVRLDDGTVQIRTVRKLEVRKGERVLVTNAGDVVPD